MNFRTILSLAALLLAVIAVTAVPALAGFGDDVAGQEPAVVIDTGVTVSDGVGISAIQLTLDN